MVRAGVALCGMVRGQDGSGAGAGGGHRAGAVPGGAAVPVHGQGGGAGARRHGGPPPRCCRQVKAEIERGREGGKSEHEERSEEWTAVTG